MYSGDTSIPDRALVGISFKFSLTSHMKNIDLVLQDATTGEDVGILGSINGRVNKNINNKYNTKIFRRNKAGQVIGI